MNDDSWAMHNVYYYLTGNILNVTQGLSMVERKSPSNYVIRIPPFTMVHIKDGVLVEKEQILLEDRDDITKMSAKIARRMLTGLYRKKKSGKLKLKRCKCK